MSASNEYWTWHLTPRGWEEGTEKLDSGTTERPVPPDTVLTLVYHECWSHAGIGSRADRWIDPDVKNQAEAAVLKKKYGATPPDMSYFKCTN